MLIENADGLMVKCAENEISQTNSNSDRYSLHSFYSTPLDNVNNLLLGKIVSIKVLSMRLIELFYIRKCFRF